MAQPTGKGSKGTRWRDTRPAQYGRIENEKRLCNAKGCMRHRSCLSGYCTTHHARDVRWGHPEGRPIKPKQYETETKQVTEIVKRNPTHPGIRRGIQFFNDWVSKAEKTITAPGMKGVVPACEILIHLKDRGVTGRDMFIRAASIWLHLDRYPAAVPGDRAFRFALADAVFKLASRLNARNPKSSDLNRSGMYIQQNLIILFANIKITIEKRLQEQQKARSEMMTPLEL